MAYARNCNAGACSRRFRISAPAHGQAKTSSATSLCKPWQGKARGRGRCHWAQRMLTRCILSGLPQHKLTRR
eukprot:6800590-Alexandrium_andersonii.AAC.1